MGGGMSDWKLVVPEATTNYCLNPSAETTGNFAAAGGAGAARSTTYQHYGLYSYHVTTNANNDGIELTLSTLSNAIHYVTMRVAGNRPDEWDWSLNDANYTSPEVLEYIDDTWTLYGLEFPAVEANGSTTLYIDQNGAGTGDFYLDGIQVEAKEYWTTYCDGTQDGCQWGGAVNASTSSRSANSRAGGRERDLEDYYEFHIGGMSGTGAAPQGITIDPYAILPGGELNNIKVDSRVFTLAGVIYSTVSQADFHDKKQALLNELQPDAYPEDQDGIQPVRLRYQGATVHKQIAAHYSSGMEGDLQATEPCFWERLAIRFESDDPYWYELGESAASLDTNDSATFTVVAARLRSTGQWDALGPPDAGGTYDQIYAIAEDDTYIYFAGNFTNFDNDADADHIVRYNKQTSTYSDMGSADGIVRDVIIGPDGTVYACGLFTNIGGVAANRIAYWDGAAWNAMGAGFNSSAYSMVFGLDGKLFVGGAFTTADGGAANRMAYWDGAAWNAMGAGMDNSVFTLDIHPDGTLYAGGDFTTAGGGAAVRMASWDGTNWSALESNGMNAAVSSIAISSDGIVYAGGAFTTAGGVTVNYVASWNGVTWSAMNNGMDDVVYALEIGPDNVLYASGSFTTAGSITVADGIARWNGSTWAHIGIDLPGAVLIRGLMTSAADPVIPRNYDIWIGWNTSGTGYFGGLVTAVNDGNAPAYPIIYYNRSAGTTATIETLRNWRTGTELLFDYDLLDGETLTIDLAQTKKTVLSSIFGPRPDAVLPGDFGNWVLKAGNNDVTSFVNVSGAPTITAWMLWKDAYRSQD
jgi:hypothetical protein